MTEVQDHSFDNPIQEEIRGELFQNHYSLKEHIYRHNTDTLLRLLLILAFLTSVIFKYALAPILAIAALGLTANSFSEEHSYFNCGFSVLGSLVCIACTVMYYIYFAR